MRVASLVMDLRSLRYFVAVAEERYFGRAAARLHMTQPPLSRAIKQLETDVGAVLLHRSPVGVTLTPAGTALYDEARALLEHAEHARARVAAAGTATFTIGTLADAFRQCNPGVRVRVLRSDPVGVVLRADDPFAGRDTLQVRDLDDRRWFQFPEGTDPLWHAYWNSTAPGRTLREGPVVRAAAARSGRRGQDHMSRRKRGQAGQVRRPPADGPPIRRAPGTCPGNSCPWRRGRQLVPGWPGTSPARRIPEPRTHARGENAW